MNGTFKLEIELGNDAMMNPGAVARTLEGVANILRRTLSPLPGKVEDGAIMDGNGNRVGSWELAADGAPNVPPVQWEQDQDDIFPREAKS